MQTAFVATAMTVATAVATCAVANASPNVVGSTYGEASSTLSSAGYSPVVVNTFGGRLGWSDCIVSRQQDRQSSDGGAQTLLTLNCNAPVAEAGVPGNSAASPEGRAAAAAAVTRVGKDRIEESLVSELPKGSGPTWAQCSGDLVGKIASSVDCEVLADHQKQTYVLTVTDVEDGRISYDIAPKT